MIAASLRALLAQVIDYAGLFPPASLSLDESIRNYARYLNGADAWMLGRFICPTARLKELEPFLKELFPPNVSPKISALGQNSASLDKDLALMKVFGIERIDIFETRVENDEIVRFAIDPDSVFLERTVASELNSSIDLSSRRPFGFKLRTGGVEASAFPTAEQISAAIAACREQGIRIKFTAGLHHPIRHFNSSVKSKMHGFINVFVAGVLARASTLPEEQLVAILLDEDAASFAFDDDGLRWKDYRATTRQIEDARKQFVISFGSCSFDEPREDLRSLGWL